MYTRKLTKVPNFICTVLYTSNSNSAGRIRIANNLIVHRMVLLQILGGWVADRLGGRWLFGGGILWCSVLTLLTPAAAQSDVTAVIGLRVLEGMFLGFMYPATLALLSRWTPESQTTRSVAIVFSGQQFGTVVAILLAGFLAEHGGWPSTFYVCGTIGLVWSAFWFLLCYSSPSAHPRISAAERQYLEELIDMPNVVEKPKTPWNRMFTSGPVWAYCVAKFAQSWGYHTMLEGLPLFYFDVLGFNMALNGLLASLPFVAAFFMLLVTGQVSDLLRAPGRISKTTVRKLFISCGLVLPSVFFILSGFLGCQRVPVVLTLITAVVCEAFAWSNVSANSLDLSLTHAATLLGIAHTVATVARISAPQVMGALTYQQPSRAQWQNVFYITAAVEWLGIIVYLLLGSGEPQNWDDNEQYPPVTFNDVFQDACMPPGRWIW